MKKEDEATCPICGEKIEVKNCQDIPLISMNHLQQFHKEAYYECLGNIAKVLAYPLPDWKTIGEDIADFAAKYDDIWNKLQGNRDVNRTKEMERE